MDKANDLERRAPGDTGPTTDEAAELKRRLEDTQRELEDKQDRLLRALAEADNIRRRGQRERDEYVKYATEALLRDLIPVLDNFDRALTAARGAQAADSVAQGVELIQRELLKVLDKYGVRRYSALGERFDPARHEAVARVESREQADSVVAETAPGYTLHDRVLRPALVAVATAPERGAA